MSQDKLAIIRIDSGVGSIQLLTHNVVETNFLGEVNTRYIENYAQQLKNDNYDVTIIDETHDSGA